MIPRLLATVLVSLVISAPLANAQSVAFFSNTTSSGDDTATFNRRMRGVEDPLIANVAAAERVGWNLYRFSAMEEVAHYILARDVGKDARQGITGTIVTTNDGPRVRFYAKDGADSYRPVADVTFAPGGLPTGQAVAADSTFTDDELALIKAREAVQSLQPTQCDDPVVTVSLLEPADKVAVYVLRDPRFSKRLPIGQHTRFEFDRSGNLLSQRDLARRCDMLFPDEREEVTTYRVSHTGDGAPTEIHVMLSLRYGKSLFIATLQNDLYWIVNNGTVTVDR